MDAINAAGDGIAYRSFTRANFRENLYRRTGGAKTGMDAHHVFPYKFKDFFKKADIDVNDPNFGVWEEASVHRKNAYKYNEEWDKFRQTNPNASKEDVFQWLEQNHNEYYEQIITD